MPLAEKRETWLNPAEWKSFDKYTTACYQGVGQLRVETFSNRKDPGMVRVWAQLWWRAEGGNDFEPTPLVVALESDLREMARKIAREEYGTAGGDA